MNFKKITPLVYTIFFLSSLLVSGSARAELVPDIDRVQSIQVLYDQQGRLTVEDLKSAKFQDISPSSIKGYVAGAIWVRVEVKPEIADEKLILLVRPNNRNEIKLFSPNPGSPAKWTTEVTGNAIPWIDRPHRAIDLGFAIQPKQSTTYYLRIQTKGAAHVSVQALPTDTVATREIYAEMFRGIYFLVMAAAVLLAAREFLLSRRFEVAVFGVANSIYICLAFTTMGYLDVLLPTKALSQSLVFWLVLMATASQIVFHGALLREFHVRKFFLALIVCALLVVVSAMALLAGSQTTIALKLNSFVVLVMAFCLVGAAWFTQKGGLPGRNTRMLYYGGLFLSVVLHLLPTLGFQPVAAWMSATANALESVGSPFVNGHLFYGFISTLLFGHLLHVRGVQDRKAARETSDTLKLAESRVEMQSEKLSEQQNLADMLSHEVRNPLATIRFSLDSLEATLSEDQRRRVVRIMRAANDIGSIVDRFVLVDSFEQNRVVKHERQVDIDLLLDDILTGIPESKSFQILKALDSPLVVTDPDILTIALTNLLENAVKYAASLDSISVVVRSTNNGMIRFEVSNDIPAEANIDTAKIFEKYYRGSHLVSRRGSGLGLFIVRWVSKLLGGQVSAFVNPQKNRFTCQLLLPRGHI